MSDYIVHASGAGNQVRIFAASTRDLVEKAREIHNTSPVATAALGRLLTAGAMMGSMMKGEKDLLTLQIQCSGPIGGLTVTAKSDGTVKGYVNNPDVMLPPNSKGKLDVGGALDLGVLSVIKDMGMKEPYVGQTQLVSGEIAEDLTYYYATSEQIPTVCGLGVLVNPDLSVSAAGGYLLQLLPGAGEETISRVEENIKKLPPVSTMIRQGMTPEQIAFAALDGFEPNILDEYEMGYVCDCSRARVERALISLGTKELGEIEAEGKPIEVGCQFCDKKYSFTPNDIKNLIKSIQSR